MPQDILVVANRRSILGSWEATVSPFAGITADTLSGYRTVILAPEDAEADALCEAAFEWKRAGLLDNTKLILGTYRGRHLWSPDNDAVVERWVVHARSECLVLESQKLAFIPLCLGPSAGDASTGDDGYLFMGGRKWREIDVGLAAMSRSGIPGKVITDFAPEGEVPGVELRRERVPREEYAAVMRRARLVLVPLKQMPISHGHTDVVAAIVAGKPVLVTAYSSCDDYVEHGVNGLLVRDNSVEAWSDAIQEAYEKADDFAAAAREMAPRYYSRRYGGYLRDVAEDPDRYRVRPEVEHAKPYAPREEWAAFRQENYLRRLKVEHRTRIDNARQMMRGRRYDEALVEVEACLDGPLSVLAAQIRDSALAGKVTAPDGGR